MQAGDEEFFRKKCNLAFGVSWTLTKISAEIVGIETAGIKRNRQYREDAGMSDPASKKPRWESETDTELQMLAASARQQRERIRLEIEKLDQLPVSCPKDVVSCPNSVLQLSNPTFDTKLPFPFVGYAVPERFQVNSEDYESYWYYTGRENFVELREEFERIRHSCQRSALTIYGTRGYGKSHLLAALVCCLAAREEKIVYIPDCREFMKQPVPYIRAAALFAWADDESKQQRIMALDTQEKIDRFFQGQSDVVFVIDQLNALEEEEGDDKPTINKKAELRYWLQGIEVTGKAIHASSANNYSILNKPLKQSSNEIMYVYGGLTEKEMEHWWAQRQEVQLGDYTKDEVEDFTGRIPWFLEKCVVNGTIDLAAKFFTEIYEQAWAFEQEIQTRYYKEPGELQRHYQYMRACLFGRFIWVSSKFIPNLVDHRYFYDDKYDSERGEFEAHYTCGICRNAVASMVLENKARFDKGIWQSLPEYTTNPCVTGFVMEQAILAWILLQGLNITPKLNHPMGVTLFQDDVPSFDTTKNDPVLYIPKVFNFRNIDGIIVYTGPRPRGRSAKNAKQKLFMFPLQITLAPDKHSKSREKFFSEWKTWTEGLQNFDVVPEFVWITPNAATTTTYEKKGQCPAHAERNVPIEHISKEIWNWYDEGKRDKRIASE